MKITFLIGNGFDLNIGMQTRYSDFYKYYLKTESKHNLITKLKENLQGDLENWADLELALGKYTKELKSIDDFDVVFDDLRKELANYIRIEENKYDFDNLTFNEVYKDLASPERHLPLADQRTFGTYKKNWVNNESIINIVSFNYSMALEKILNFKDEKISLHQHTKGIKSSSLYLINHIHGYTSREMVLGVNDISQIDNEAFKTNPDVLAGLVKPECNKGYKHLIDAYCTDMLLTSNLICLFGLSIGDTDKIWWEIIGQHICKSNCRLFIFMRGDDLPINQEYKKIRKENFIKNYFLQKTDLTEAEKEQIKEKIYIGYNTNIFNVKVQKKKENNK